MKVRALCLGLLLVLTACASASTGGPSQFVRFSPPTLYAEWWDEMEACSERQGTFAAVSWYFVPGEYVDIPTPETVASLHRPTQSIYLPARAVWAKGVVQHEMLHVLEDTSLHPVPPFGVCAPVVAVFP